eukprot:TRINITY_DN7004_c0_g1_i2.p1 TRINITY_DN7004_c0_g1~~TRINITY_DN7004_c0_g1_i2.p1  ORF type:complete len:203 (+),score=17.62 TRINITY_DN7004_c0_g1_i2:149-757(+)
MCIRDRWWADGHTAFHSNITQFLSKAPTVFGTGMSPPVLGRNNVFGHASLHEDTDTVKYLGTHNTWEECREAAHQPAANGLSYRSFVYHSKQFGDPDWVTRCYARTDTQWDPVPEQHTVSGLIEQTLTTPAGHARGQVGRSLDALREYIKEGTAAPPDHIVVGLGSHMAGNKFASVRALIANPGWPARDLSLIHISEPTRPY